MNDGEEARGLRTPVGPLRFERPLRDDDAPDPRLNSLLFSLGLEVDHSLSVAGELQSSGSLPAPAELEVRLRLEQLEFMLPFSFSSKPKNMRDRASLYAASRSSMVGRFFL